MVINKKIQTTSTKCQYQAAASKPKCWSFVNAYWLKTFWTALTSLKTVNSCCDVVKLPIRFINFINCKFSPKKREAVIKLRNKQNKRKIVPMVTCKPWNPVVTKNVETLTFSFHRNVIPYLYSIPWQHKKVTPKIIVTNKCLSKLLMKV